MHVEGTRNLIGAHIAFEPITSKINISINMNIVSSGSRSQGLRDNNSSMDFLISNSDSIGTDIGQKHRAGFFGMLIAKYNIRWQ